MSKTPYLARPSLSMREDAKLGNYLNMINTTGEAFGKLHKVIEEDVTLTQQQKNQQQFTAREAWAQFKSDFQALEKNRSRLNEFEDYHLDILYRKFYDIRK